MFLYDTSPEQQRTRRMADGTLKLTLRLLGLAKLAILKPIRKTIHAGRPRVPLSGVGFAFTYPTWEEAAPELVARWRQCAS